jgi:alpha-D-xyloside xylohydrolase
MYAALVKFLRLRYRLLPYIYALAGWTTHDDYTMLRLLAFDFRADANTYDIRDQFMFGPALLVCPVTHPMVYTAGSVPVEGAAKTRTVYLPADNDWYNFWTDECLAGGQTVQVAADLDLIPLFVRAGSIIPQRAPAQCADEAPDAVVELHVYSGCDGRFRLYEDAGDGYDYEHGAFSTIEIEWQEAPRRLTIGERSGRYPGMPEQRSFLVVLHGDQQPERRRPELIDAMLLAYEGRPLTVEL